MKKNKQENPTYNMYRHLSTKFHVFICDILVVVAYNAVWFIVSVGQFLTDNVYILSFGNYYADVF